MHMLELDPSEMDFDTLKANVALLERELDDKNQRVYDCRKKLAITTALESDYLQEIEALELLDEAKIKELQKTVKQLEENVTQFKKTRDLQLQQKQNLIEDVQNQIDEILLKNKASHPKDAKLYEVVEDDERQQLLKAEIKQASYKLVEVQMRIQSLQAENSKLQKVENDLVRKVDNEKKSLTNKINGLGANRNKIQHLQEEIFATKLDLDSAKSKPLDPSKQGNSLFAEVEDSRLKMEKAIAQTKKTYSEIKRNVCVKLQKMSILRAENQELSRQLDNVQEHDAKWEQEFETYRSEISALESRIASYKEELAKEKKFKGEDLPTYAVEFANCMFMSKWKEEEKVRCQLDEESKEKLQTFDEIQLKDAELRKIRRKCKQLEVKLDELKNLLLETRLQSSPTEDEAKFFHTEASQPKPQIEAQQTSPACAFGITNLNKGDSLKKSSNNSSKLGTDRSKSCPLNMRSSAKPDTVTVRSSSHVGVQLNEPEKNATEANKSLPEGEPKTDSRRQTLLSYMNDIGHVPAENRISINTNVSESFTYVDMQEEIQQNVDDSLLNDILSNMEKLGLSHNNCDVTEDFKSETFEEANMLFLQNAGHTPSVNRQQLLEYYTLTTPECVRTPDFDQTITAGSSDCKQTQAVKGKENNVNATNWPIAKKNLSYISK